MGVCIQLIREYVCISSSILMVVGSRLKAEKKRAMMVTLIVAYKLYDYVGYSLK